MYEWGRMSKVLNTTFVRINHKFVFRPPKPRYRVNERPNYFSHRQTWYKKWSKRLSVHCMNFRCTLKAVGRFPRRVSVGLPAPPQVSVCLNPAHTIRKVSLVCPRVTLHKFKHRGVCDRGKRMSCLSEEELWNGHSRPQASPLSLGIKQIKHSRIHTDIYLR